MQSSRRAGLAGIAALALLAAPALAQTSPGSSDTPTTASEGGTAKPDMPAGAPTPQEPAATETPSQPAASGGDASDATPSGQPAGSSVTGPASGTETAPAPSATPALEPGNTGASPINPRNSIGDKFELPRVGNDNQVEMITGICGVQMKGMSTASCTCLAEKALTTLSDPQRDYLIASVVAPPVSDRMLKDGRVGDADQKLIFAFLNKTSTECTASTGGSAPAGGADSGAAKPGAATPQTQGGDGDGGGMSNQDGAAPKMDTPPTAQPKPAN